MSMATAPMGLASVFVARAVKWASPDYTKRLGPISWVRVILSFVCLGGLKLALSGGILIVSTRFGWAEGTFFDHLPLGTGPLAIAVGLATTTISGAFLYRRRSKNKEPAG